MISGTMLADQKLDEHLLNPIARASKDDDEKNVIRVVELFAGIGAQHQALENLGIPHEIVAISEIDKHAIAGYNAIHGETPNLGDICKIEHLPECDLITYSFPCQDLSVAGNKGGMEEGSNTRSSLLWEVGRLLDDMHERGVLPETLLMENVDAILNKKNIDQFRKWIMKLNAMGYTSSYAVLNAKDYGIPQNRKRCFMVSTLTFGELEFPQGFPLELRLKDMLEDDVPESYYLSQERIDKFEEHRKRNESKGNGFGWKPIDPERERVTNTITDNPNRNASGNWIKEEIPKSECQGETGLQLAGNLNDNTRTDQHNRVYSTNGVSPTICGCGGGGVMPQIMEKSGIILAGEIKNDSTFTAGKTVYSSEGVAPTLTCTHPGIEDCPRFRLPDTWENRPSTRRSMMGGGFLRQSHRATTRTPARSSSRGD